MKITVINQHGTGVTITEIFISEIQKPFPVSISPGSSDTIDLPDLDCCHVAVTYTETGLPPPTKVQRPSPVTGDSSVSLVKSHDGEKPHLI